MRAQKRRNGWLLWALGCGLAVPLMTALFVGEARSAPSSSDVAEQPRAVLLVTGAVEGYLDQCGCPKNPMGGLSKRAGYLVGLRRRWSQTPLILLDSGNFSDTPSPGGKVKTKGIIEGMSSLGYSAVGVGERELTLGYEELRRLTTGVPYPLVSANVVDIQSGQRLFAASTTVEQGGLRFAITSVARANPSVESRTAEGRRVGIADPIESLSSLVPALRSSHDVVVVLAALPIEDATVIAQRVPGIDLIVGAFAARTTDRAERVGATRLMYVSDQGKAFGQLELYRAAVDSPFRIESRVAGLGDAVATDDSMDRLVMRTLQAAQEADVKALLPPVGQSETGAVEFVGVGACTACHAPVIGQWTKSKHALAWKTLEQAEGGEPKQLQCFGCHSVGFGQPSGFRNARETPHLSSVGCESCHGPGSAHRSNPEATYGKTTMSTCTACHTAETDPDFNYYEALRAIAHPTGR
ncbi:MAG: multiheme c-type cytochrome [Acidobacteriota bacterium]